LHWGQGARTAGKHIAKQAISDQIRKLVSSPRRTPERKRFNHFNSGRELRVIVVCGCVKGVALNC